MSLVDLSNEYVMCPRCGQAVERDGVHECVDRSEYTYEGGYSKMRSVEELEKLPIAVILDDELGVLVNGCKNGTGLDARLLSIVIEGRGLKDRFPEMFV